MSTISASCSDLPIGCPAAARNVLAMPPPTISLSTLPSRFSSTVSLVETFEPPTIAISGRFGLPSAFSSASSSPVSSGPAQATGANFATPCVLASARCAVANASMTYTSHSAAIFCATSSLFFFSPLLKRTFSSSTISPGSHATPSSQSFSKRTLTPSSSAMRAATGASENSSLYTPSSGRPRCDMSITRAPALWAASIVGSDARMRASLVTTPFLTGTLRSSRISTRLPFRSRSVIRSTPTMACSSVTWR